MKSIVKRISLLLVVMLAAVSMSAQNPIKWRTSVKMTSKTEGVITLKAVVSQGWHLYGLQLPDDGPRPTVIDFSTSTGIKLVGSVTPARKASEHKDDVFGMTLSWWDKDISFTQKFKVTNKKTAKINGKVSYMSCNDETCMPPATENISVAVPAYKSSK
jgi:thiol:disulfide interchange protein DsbD